MITGLFGYSLIFELLVFYFAWTLFLEKVDRNWLYFILGIVILLVWTLPSSAEWALLFGGHFDFLWDEIASNFGFR
jgi:hypothetical protein